eukprot:996186-Amphidinium_carterae.3
MLGYALRGVHHEGRPLASVAVSTFLFPMWSWLEKVPALPAATRARMCKKQLETESGAKWRSQALKWSQRLESHFCLCNSSEET